MKEKKPLIQNVIMLTYMLMKSNAQNVKLDPSEYIQ